MGHWKMAMVISMKKLLLTMKTTLVMSSLSVVLDLGGIVVVPVATGIVVGGVVVEMAGVGVLHIDLGYKSNHFVVVAAVADPEEAGEGNNTGVDNTVDIAVVAVDDAGCRVDDTGRRTPVEMMVIVMSPLGYMGSRDRVAEKETVEW